MFMRKFEYKTYVYAAKGVWGGKIDDTAFTAELNEYGRDSWELVSMTAANEAHGRTCSFICVFKREVM
jgi:hypothetical protein